MNQQQYDETIRNIKSNLQPGEKWLAELGASFERTQDSYDVGVLVATSARLIYRGSRIGLSSSFDWQYPQISGLQKSRKLLFEFILVNAGGAGFKFMVPRGEGDKFLTIVNAAITKFSQSKSLPNQPERKSSPNLTSDLEKLAQLYKNGLLSEMEYAAAKNKLLG